MLAILSDNKNSHHELARLLFFYKYYRIVLILFVTSLFLNCASISSEMGGSSTGEPNKPASTFSFPPAPEGIGKVKVIVLDFKNNSQIESGFLGAAITSTMINALTKSGRFTVIEREVLEDIIEEQNLGLAGITDPRTAAEIGKVFGVEYIITGSVSEVAIQQSSTRLGFTATRLGVSKGTVKATIDIRIIDPVTTAVMFTESGVGSQSSKNIDIAFNEVNLLTGVVGFDETLVGQATRKAVNNVVLMMLDTPWK